MDKKQLKIIADRILPAPIHRFFGTQLLGDKYRPSVGMVNFGSLRRLTPISRNFGYDRGRPIDRYYIENFLARHADDIQGHVLEIGDASYTRQFGGDRVTKSDVVHVTEDNPEATIVGDLANAPQIPDNTFDCFILTQTLLCIYDLRAAMTTIHRILKPGGVVLATLPGMTQLSDDQWGDYFCWAFTSQSARRLFEEVFPKGNIQVETFGNVLAAMAYLQGIAVEELRQSELDYRDPLYQLSITVRATKG